MMRSSLKKLRGLATLHRSEEPREVVRKRDFCCRPPHPRDLAHAAQEIKDIRSCYDDLISASAAAANSVFEFSEALKEMGTCLLEKNALNDDEENEEVLLMLGKAQFALQKLVDNYRANIIQTIATPSESLLSELQTVEEMKQHCDEKREVFELMSSAQKEKGSSKKHIRRVFSSQQVQMAQEEYCQEINLFALRLKTLKQGQSQSLLTQAARHYAAQLSFFRKASNSLETIEPYVEMAAKRQHINYKCNDIEDSEIDDDDNACSYSTSDDSEMSFDYDKKEQGQQFSSTFSNLVGGNPHKDQDNFLTFIRKPKLGSQSGPIFPDMKHSPSKKLKEMNPAPTRNTHTYVLPTPMDCKRTESVYSENFPRKKLGSLAEHPRQLWHSSPLTPEMNTKGSRDDRLSGLAQPVNRQSAMKDSNTNFEPTRMFSPSEGLLFPQFDPSSYLDTRNIKRQAFSGPLLNKAGTRNPMSSLSRVEHPSVHFTLPLNQSSKSPKVSPPHLSSPKISELHELPRPPIPSSVKPTRPAGLISHSAPLASGSVEQFVTSKRPSVLSCTPSSLPTVAVTVSPTFSVTHGRRIPSTTDNFMEDHKLYTVEHIDSPPLTPIVLADIRRVSKSSRCQTRGLF